MPAWMLGALALLAPFARRGVSTALRLARTRGGVAALGAGAGLAAGGVGIPGVDLFGEDGELIDRPRRRRRRRALTASDRADIAFITGLLGAGAGKNFALTIATRT